MNRLLPGTADLTITIQQDVALERLNALDSPSIPTFFSCGIIDTDIGYYQLARLPDGKRILIFGFNLEDLQLKEFPGYGNLFAHPAKLYGIDAFEEDISFNDIYQALTNHQAALKRIMREEYMLVRTGTYVYQSRAISYTISRKINGTAPILPDDLVEIDTFVDALHDKKYARIYYDKDANLYNHVRCPRVRLTHAGAIPYKDALRLIQEHHTTLLTDLTEGRDGIQHEDKALTWMERFCLRLRIYSARLLSNLHKALDETVEEYKGDKVSGVFNLAQRGAALAKIPVAFHENLIELVLSLKEAFEVEHVGGSEPKIPEALKPYVSEFRLHTRFNQFLHPLRIEKVEAAVPLSLHESRLCPLNVKAVSEDPFQPTSTKAPGLGAVRSPLGTIVHMYPNSGLLIQANGVWIALCHDTQKTYAGYNKDMDTQAKPSPRPILREWMGEQKALCYEHDHHEYAVKSVDFETVHLAVKEITDHGDGHLLGTHRPECDIGPYVIPARKQSLHMHYTLKADTVTTQPSD